LSDPAFTLQLRSAAVIELQCGQRLNAEDLLGLHSSAVDGVIAEVDHNPADPNVLGLKNLSDRAWTTSAASGQGRVERGRSIRLGAVSAINFGPVTAQVARGTSGFMLMPPGAPAIHLRPKVKVTAPMLLGLSGIAPRGVVAEVEQNPRDPSVLGLKNLSGWQWTAVMPNGAQHRIPSGRALRLIPGARIDFGSVQAQVRADPLARAVTCPLQGGGGGPALSWLSLWRESWVRWGFRAAQLSRAIRARNIFRIAAVLVVAILIGWWVLGASVASYYQRQRAIVELHPENAHVPAVKAEARRILDELGWPRARDISGNPPPSNSER
jgi:hypothetical protein